MGSSGTKRSSPSLPLELVEEEILCRLPVKILLQLRCICKSWKSLISDDPKFAKKHLFMSKILKHQQHHHVIVNDLCDRILWDLPLSSIFSNVSNTTVSVTQTQLNIPIFNSRSIWEVCSCDGILCFTLGGGRGEEYLLFCVTLPLENTLHCLVWKIIGKEKLGLLYLALDMIISMMFLRLLSFLVFMDEYSKVDVYTLGTNDWRSIQDFPISSLSMYQHGVFVGHTVNWLTYEVSNTSYCRVIVSLDLEKESYQKIPRPDLEMDHWALGMFRDCLCIFASNDMFLDVWIMKEYGINESWTKLYNVREQYINLKTVYIFEDDQMLFSFYDMINSESNLVVYNSNNGNMKIPKIQNITDFSDLNVYMESLISLPYSY